MTNGRCRAARAASMKAALSASSESRKARSMSWTESASALQAAAAFSTSMMSMGTAICPAARRHSSRSAAEPEMAITRTETRSPVMRGKPPSRRNASRRRSPAATK